MRRNEADPSGDLLAVFSRFGWKQVESLVSLLRKGGVVIRIVQGGFGLLGHSMACLDWFDPRMDYASQILKNLADQSGKFWKDLFFWSIRKVFPDTVGQKRPAHFETGL